MSVVSSYAIIISQLCGGTAISNSISFHGAAEGLVPLGRGARLRTSDSQGFGTLSTTRKPARTQYARGGAFLGLFSLTARAPGRE